MTKMVKKKNRVITGTRRGNREGSIYQRKDGRWVGIATVGYNDDGKIIRKSIYGKSRMEVANKLNELTNRIETNNYDYVNKSTFSQLMTEWLLVFKKTQVSPRTFEGVFRNFKLHIEPKIGNMKIDEVNSIVIQKILNSMLEQDYSLAVVKKIKFIFNQFFNYAVDHKMVETNPTTKTRVRSSKRKINDNENKYKAIPPEVREEFLHSLNNHKFLKPLCFCMMFAGLRTGEVLALEWKNINFKTNTISIERGITVIPKFDENGNVKERVTVISEAKTACSVRSVPMPEILIEALKEYKIEQEINEEEHSSDLLSKNSLVFGNYDGSVRSYSGTRKIFNNFLKKYDLAKYNIHFHGLRHTYSNMLFEADTNPKVIQALLGHKSVKTTITTYNSVDKSYFKKATDVINNQFSSKKLKESDEKIDNEIEELERLLEEKRQQRRSQEESEM